MTPLTNPHAGAPAPARAVRIDAIAALRDNYIWLLDDGERAAVVDPGDAAPVLRALDQRGRALDAILLTHHHADHVGGVAALVQAHGARVYGPANTPFAPLDTPLRGGDAIRLLGQDFTVLDVPGHTLDHIAYWCAPLAALFCGDTLFSGGCGRIFEGTPPQMFESLQRIAALPEGTRIYCAHEYTLANLRFALGVEPDNAELQGRNEKCRQLRARGVPTVPSTLAVERASNPFLRCGEPTVRAAVQRRDPRTGSAPAEVFAALRAWKDVS